VYILSEAHLQFQVSETTSLEAPSTRQTGSGPRLHRRALVATTEPRPDDGITFTSMFVFFSSIDFKLNHSTSMQLLQTQPEAVIDTDLPHLCQLQIVAAWTPSTLTLCGLAANKDLVCLAVRPRLHLGGPAYQQIPPVRRIRHQKWFDRRTAELL
jgi:hypothetical protein